MKKMQRNAVVRASSVALLAIALATAGSVHAADIYVDKNCTGAVHDGTSWATAHLDLNPALVATGAGNTIHVARGVYKPTDGSDRGLSFVMKSGVALLGGYPTGGGPRDAAANPTVLSGDLAGNDTTDANGVVLAWGGIVAADNSRHVVRAEGVSATAVLDGFTVTAGYSDDTTTFWEAGGAGAGLFAFGYTGGSPTVSNVVFRGNHAIGGGGGAAIYGGTPTFTNVTFRANAADQGGGFYASNGCWWGCGGGAVAGTPTLTNVVFRENAAYQSTGAVPMGGGMAAAYSTCTLTHVQFLSNTSTGGAAGLASVYGTAALTDVLFDGNNDTAPNSGGGGMEDYGGSTLVDVTFRNNHSNWGGGLQVSGAGTTLTRVTFTGNSASMGGGLSAYDTTVATDCVFAGNTATNSGGGIVVYNGNLTLTNARLTGNSAYYGAGIHVNAGTTTLTNVTVAGNSGPGLQRQGTLHVRNSIVWGNSGGSIAGGATSVSYSIVQGGADAAAHVLDTDPLFVTGDFHLSAASPAVDAGDNAVTSPSLPATDLDGNPRRVDVVATADTGSGTPPIVDLGAYERANSEPLATATVLNVSPSSAGLGVPVTLTATVTAGASPVASGVVQFLDGGVPIGRPVALAGGTATMTRSFDFGVHVVTAEFPANGTHLPSTSNSVPLNTTPVTLQGFAAE